MKLMIGTLMLGAGTCGVLALAYVLSPWLCGLSISVILSAVGATIINEAVNEDEDE